MHSIKYILKRIIIGVGIALALMFIKGNLLMQVQAKSLLTTKIPQEVYVFNNNQTAFTTTIDNPFFKNAGIGYLYFTFSTNKSSGNATDPISMIRSVAVTTGGVNYTCDIGTTSLSNSTYGGNIYSVRCPINIGSSGVTNIIYHPTDLQTNSLSLYRFTNDGYFTFESDSTVNVNVDTSSTTSAINNQTSTITNNQNQNTQSIINNQNQNTQDIINNQNDLLGTPCTNIFNKNNYTSINYFINASVNQLNSNSTTYTFYIPIKSNTTYTVRKNGGNRFAIGFSSSSPANGISLTGIVDDRTQSYLTSSSSSDSSYLYIYVNSGSLTTSQIQSIADTLQVVEGSTNKPYCAYGTSTSSKLDDTNDKLDSVNSSINNVNNTINNSNVGASNDLFSDYIEDFDPNTHGLTRIVLAPLQLVSSILDTSCSSFSIPLPFVDSNVVLPCMSTIYNSQFPHFLVIYRLITDGIISYWVSINVFRKVKGFLDPTDDKVEVFDL